MILYSAGLDFTASLSLTLGGFGAAIIFGIRVRCDACWAALRWASPRSLRPATPQAW